MAENVDYKRRDISIANVTSTLANDPYYNRKIWRVLKEIHLGMSFLFHQLITLRD